MRSLLFLLPALLTSSALPAQTPAPAKPPDPPAITILEVRATDLVGISTVRASYRLGFEVVRVVHDGAKLAAGEQARVRDGRFGFGLYQGADRQDGVDSFERLSALLEAKPGERDPKGVVERPYTIGHRDAMTLMIVHRPGTTDLLILERQDGTRALISLQNR